MKMAIGFSGYCSLCICFLFLILISGDALSKQGDNGARPFKLWMTVWQRPVMRWAIWRVAPISLFPSFDPYLWRTAPIMFISLGFLSRAILFVQTVADYYEYSSGRSKSHPAVMQLELLTARAKRYVEEPILQLSDSYQNSLLRENTMKRHNRRLQDRDMDSLSQVGLRSNLAENVPDSVATLLPTTTQPAPAPKKPDSVPKKVISSYNNPPLQQHIIPTSGLSQPLADTVQHLAAQERHLAGESDLDDVALDNFSDEISNTTLEKNNITKNEEDHHLYYNSSFIVNPVVGKYFWVNMSQPGVKVNDVLAKSHRRAATVKLSFDFPFYGHHVRNVTIATGGFLFTGDYIHSWLAATQYIAPLMANFDTSLSTNSYVKYIDNGTAFTVEWERVVLQDKPNAGDFTFQVTLHNNGDIVFVYRSIPIVVEEIEDDIHPVKVGLSDAYIIDRTIFFVRRKTIYEYHRVNFKQEDIKNWTVIYMNALPTCLDLADCKECLTAVNSFNCKWCQSAGRCSSGMDRMRQDWIMKHCDHDVMVKPDQCDAAHSNSVIHHDSIVAPELSPTVKHVPDKSRGFISAGVFGVMLALTAFICIAIWVIYAYRNPHSSPGQILIRYRPSTWGWRRGEARYTAATIHM